MTRTVFIDVSELVENPIRTGIQRVEREILRHWPAAVGMELCRFDAARGAFCLLPRSALEILLSRDPQAQAVEEQRALLEPALTHAEPVAFGPGSVLFNPEIFWGRARAETYRDILSHKTADVAWLVYDFLTFLRPQDYPQGAVRNCMHYLRAMRQVRRLAFISERTRREYALVFGKPATGPVIPLGADGLGPDRLSFNAGSSDFVYIGTIEPRKNVALLLQVFAGLWRDGFRARLVLAGRTDSRATREIALLEEFAGQEWLRHLGPVSDRDAARLLSAARALVYPSEFEGFGLPPVEALHAGVPAIVSSHLPSIEMLPPHGQVRLDTMTHDALRGAVISLLDDAAARELWRSASTLNLPGWKQTVQGVVAWASEAEGG